MSAYHFFKTNVNLQPDPLKILIFIWQGNSKISSGMKLIQSLPNYSLQDTKSSQLFLTRYKVFPIIPYKIQSLPNYSLQDTKSSQLFLTRYKVFPIIPYKIQRLLNYYLQDTKFSQLFLTRYKVFSIITYKSCNKT